MKQIINSSILLSAFVTIMGFSATTLAKDYQVTGPVVEVSDTKIIVDKKGEKFEIAKTPATKAADVKVGDKVTVYYSMTATEIEVKPAGKKK